jgi:type VI secretion system protein ImpD
VTPKDGLASGGVPSPEAVAGRTGRASQSPAALVARLLGDEPGLEPGEAEARASLFRCLTERFGPTLEGAWLDRDWIVGALDREIAAIDQLLADQVSAVLHARPFQRLEARWRGLAYLSRTVDESGSIRLRLMTASWNEVVRDLERAPEFDQSEMFRKIYSGEFGMPGGEPFGLMICDYEVQHRPTPDHATDDISALTALASVAAASFCPFILGLSPRILQLDSFRDLGRPMDLRAVFTQPDYLRWSSMRGGDDMRFIGLAMPRILMRPPWRADTRRDDGFPFEESVRDDTGDGHLWGAAGFAFAAVVMRAFAQNGWFADLRGAPLDEVRGGLVADLPIISFDTDRKGLAIKPSTECILSDAHETELTELGIMALCKMQFTDYSVFYGNPSIQRPVLYDRMGATTNARLSSMLQYVLCVSRFAHFIKVLGRDKVGSMATAQSCEDMLAGWLRGYCEGNDSASQETKARRPLREARVKVSETPGKPGSYACTVHLRPHFQLDDIATGFRLTTELAPPSGA